MALPISFLSIFYYPGASYTGNNTYGYDLDYDNSESGCYCTIIDGSTKKYGEGTGLLRRDIVGGQYNRGSKSGSRTNYPGYSTGSRLIESLTSRGCRIRVLSWGVWVYRW